MEDYLDLAVSAFLFLYTFDSFQGISQFPEFGNDTLFLHSCVGTFFVATAPMQVATMPSIQKSVSLSVLYFGVSPNYERN